MAWKGYDHITRPVHLPDLLPCPRIHQCHPHPEFEPHPSAAAGPFSLVAPYRGCTRCTAAALGVQYSHAAITDNRLPPPYSPTTLTLPQPQSLSLTPQQRLALSALFRRIKAAHTALLQQHDTLLQQLQGLQQQRHQEQLWFAQQAHQLPILRTAQALGRCRQGEGEVLPQGQQQQQGLALPPHQQQHSRWWQELEQMQVQQEQQEQPLFPEGGCLMDRLNCASDIVLTDPMVASASYPEFAQQPQQPPLQQQQQQRRRQPHLQLLLDPLLVSSDPCLDVLLAPPSPDQRRLEAQLSALRDRVALGEQLLAAQLLTMLDPKQLAQLVVSSWPFCPDSLAVSASDYWRQGGGGEEGEGEGGGWNSLRGLHNQKCVWAGGLRSWWCHRGPSALTPSR